MGEIYEQLEFISKQVNPPEPERGMWVVSPAFYAISFLVILT